MPNIFPSLRMRKTRLLFFSKKEKPIFSDNFLIALASMLKQFLVVNFNLMFHELFYSLSILQFVLS